MSRAKVLEDCLQYFLCNFEPFTFGSFPKLACCTSKDTFDAFIAEYCYGMSLIYVMTSDVGDVRLCRFRRRFLGCCGNELCERLELNWKRGVKTVVGSESFKGGLSDSIDSTSVGSEFMPK